MGCIAEGAEIGSNTVCVSFKCRRSSSRASSLRIHDDLNSKLNRVSMSAAVCVSLDMYFERGAYRTACDKIVFVYNR
jgi:hypothetical protein